MMSAREAEGIGAQGELWFASQLPRGWLPQSPRFDRGKDYTIVVQDNSDLHNLEFSVQVKSSEAPTIRRGRIVVSGVPHSSVRYWFANPSPTLVVAVDVMQQRGWFAWHLDLFQSPQEVFDSGTRTLSVRIPEVNELNAEGWRHIREQLKRYFSSLQAALKDSSILLPAVCSISTGAGNLMKLSNSPPPDHQPDGEESTTILIEMIQHRNILLAIRRLLDHINPDSQTYKQIQFWIESYEATVLTGFPLFKNLPSDDNYSPDLQLAFAPKLVSNTRSLLIESGLEMIRMLSSPYIEMEAEKRADAK